MHVNRSILFARAVISFSLRTIKQVQILFVNDSCNYFTFKYLTFKRTVSRTSRRKLIDAKTRIEILKHQ